MVSGNDAEDRLFKELFETRPYNKYSTPVASRSETIHVKFGIVLLKILQVVCEIGTFILLTGPGLKVEPGRTGSETRHSLICLVYRGSLVYSFIVRNYSNFTD